MVTVTESIYSSKRLVIPLADVRPIRRWRLTVRYFIRGIFFLEPYGRRVGTLGEENWRLYFLGSRTRVVLILASIPAAIFGLGFAAGRLS